MANLGLYEHELTNQIPSTAGVRQGMVLAPVLFSLGLHTVLYPIIQIYKKVKVIAYLDDVTVIGKHGNVQQFLNEAN